MRPNRDEYMSKRSVPEQRQLVQIPHLFLSIAAIMITVMLISLDSQLAQAQTETTSPTPSGTSTQQNATMAVTNSATAVATITPITPVATNGQWQPVIQDFNGVSMVLVPPGCFVMGTDSGGPDETPTTKICLDKAFWLDRYAVTNDQFSRVGGKAKHKSIQSGPQYPREQITWFEAHDYCALRGARLLTEAEWEYAARGPDDLIYPWGNTFVPDNVVFAGNSGSKTAPVGSKPGGVSWVGAYDMIGNSWSWTGDLFKPYPYDPSAVSSDPTDTTSQRTLRSGSFGGSVDLLRGSFRYGAPPDLISRDVGVRCAQSAQ